MKILLIFVLLYLLITLVFLSVDAYFWWMERYPRYKIGRWTNNEKVWREKVYNIGLAWLPKVPAAPVSQNRYLVLWDIIQKKYIRNSVQAWQTGGLLIGVTAYRPKNAAKAINTTINHFIKPDGNWKTDPKNIDFAILLYSLLEHPEQHQKIKPAVDYMIHLIEEHIGSDGLLVYTSGRNKLRYVDTIGLVCPFLVLYDKIYGGNRYTTLALAQIDDYLENGLFKDSFLPVHAYQLNTGLPIGVYGWGRGTGWLILGMLDVFLLLEESEQKQKLKEKIKAAADSWLNFQRADGGFGVFIQDTDTYDSSATSIFAYFYLKCGNIFNDSQYTLAGQKAISKLKLFTRRNGALDYCQGDTVDVGVFSQRFDILPFAQGMLLRALSNQQKIQS